MMKFTLKGTEKPPVKIDIGLNQFGAVVLSANNTPLLIIRGNGTISLIRASEDLEKLQRLGFQIIHGVGVVIEK